jgi:hypothetical protein
VLRNHLGQEITALKREYYRLCLSLLDELKQTRGGNFTPRIAVLSLFGMMNWIYTWHNAKVDSSAKELAREMGDILLNGVCGVGSAIRKKSLRP